MIFYFDPQKYGIVLGDLGEKLTLGNGDPIVGFRDVGYLGKKIEWDTEYLAEKSIWYGILRSDRTGYQVENCSFLQPEINRVWDIKNSSGKSKWDLTLY